MKPDKFGCIGNTIKVAAGHYVDLRNPDPQTIDMFSIAAALGSICRFGGHCPQFYSVAEHCMHAVLLAAEDGVSREAQQAILLHDAAEAFIGDIVKPLKNMLPEFRVIEERFDRAIEQQFGVDLLKHAGTIKRYDRAMLKAEKIALWPDDAERWTGFGEIEHRKVNFRFCDPAWARNDFVLMAELLDLHARIPG